MTVRARVAAIALPVMILCALALTVIDRPGYSPDEELTAVIVAGISQSGAPLLPSGVLYNRGLPYTYFAWAIGEVGGHALWSYRVASFLCAVAGIVVILPLGRRLGNAAFGIVAAVLLASFPAYIAAAVFARPYAALVLCTLVFLVLFWRWLSNGGRIAGVLVALALVVLLHPLGAALVAIPWMWTAMTDRRGPALRVAILSSIVAVATVGAGYGAHFLSLVLTGTPFHSGTAIYAIPAAPRPPMFAFRLVGWSGWMISLAVFTVTAALLIRRARLNPGIVLVCAAAGLSFQLGLLVLAAVAGVIGRPRDWRQWSRAGGVIGILSIAWWSGLIAFRANAQFSVDFVASLARSATTYPLSTFSHTARLLPVLSILAIVGTMASLRHTSDRTSVNIRVLALFTVVFLGASDALGVPLIERYLLLPWTFLVLLAAHGAIACAYLAKAAAWQRPVLAVPALATASCVLFALTADGQYRYARERGLERSGETAATAMLAPRTGTWTPAGFRALLQPRDTVICTEEIACLYLLGRADYLFALPPQDTEDYVATRAGASVGYYASRPVISDEARLSQVLRDMPSDRCAIVVSLNTGKTGFGHYADLASRAAGKSDFQTLVNSDETFIARACGTGPRLTAERQG